MLTSPGAKVQVWPKSTAPALKCGFIIDQNTGRLEGETCASAKDQSPYPQTYSLRLRLTDPQTQPQTETCLLILGQVRKVGPVGSQEAANIKRLVEGRAGMGKWKEL